MPRFLGVREDTRIQNVYANTITSYQSTYFPSLTGKTGLREIKGSSQSHPIISDKGGV